jgi:hypothetical protein
MPLTVLSAEDIVRILGLSICLGVLNASPTVQTPGEDGPDEVRFAASRLA